VSFLLEKKWDQHTCAKFDRIWSTRHSQ